MQERKSLRQSLFLPQKSQSISKEVYPNFVKSPKSKLGIQIASPYKKFEMISPRVRESEELSLRQKKIEADKSCKISQVQKKQAIRSNNDLYQQMKLRYSLSNSIQLNRQELTQRINPQRQKQVYNEPKTLKKARSISIIQQYQQQKRNFDKSYKMKTTSQLIDQIQQLKIEKSSLEQYQAEYQKKKLTEIKQLKDQIEILNKERENFNKQKEQKDIYKQKREDEHSQLKKEVIRCHQFIQKVQQENSNYLNTIQQLKSQNTSFVTVIQKLSAQLAKTQENLNAQKNNSDFFKQTVGNLQIKLKQYSNQLKKSQAQIKGLQNMLNKSQKQSDRFSKHQNESKDKLNEKPTIISVKKVQNQQNTSISQKGYYQDREFKSQIRYYFKQIMEKISDMRQNTQKQTKPISKLSYISNKSQLSEGFEECCNFTSIQSQKLQLLSKKMKK